MVVVGPDGVGKSSVAAAICAAVAPDGAYFHFRPPVLSSLLEEPPEHTVPPPTKGSPHGSVLLGWVRLARNLVRFWAGYLVQVKPAVRRGVMVVGDRWAYGYLAQPFPLKFYGPQWLARLALGFMPQPDLVVNLTADADTIHARKTELDPTQISSELGRWAELPVATLVSVSTEQPVSSAAGEILRWWDTSRGDSPSHGHKDFPPGWRHLSIPTSSKSAARAGLTMYTAGRTRGLIAQRAAWVVVGALGPWALPGRSRGWPVPFDDEVWAALLETWRRDLGAFDSHAIYRPRQSDRKGVALLLIDGERPRAFVKVRSDPARLKREERALGAMTCFGPTEFTIPRVLAAGTVGPVGFLALSPMPARIHRPPHIDDLSSIAKEIQVGLAGMPRPPGIPAHFVPMHGDLTPWNLRQSGDELFLIDWEDAGWGPPGADAVLFAAAVRALGKLKSSGSYPAEAIDFWKDRISGSDDGFSRELLHALGQMERMS